MVRETSSECERAVQIRDREVKKERDTKGQGLSLPQSIILIAKLAEIRDWSEVFDDPIFREHAFHSYERLRQLYSDLLVVREMKTTIGERCVAA